MCHVSPLSLFAAVVEAERLETLADKGTDQANNMRCIALSAPSPDPVYLQTALVSSPPPSAEQVDIPITNWPHGPLYQTKMRYWAPVQSHSSLHRPHPLSRCVPSPVSTPPADSEKADLSLVLKK